MSKYEIALKTISAMFIPVIIDNGKFGIDYSNEHLYNTELYQHHKKYFDDLQELVDLHNKQLASQEYLTLGINFTNPMGLIPQINPNLTPNEIEKIIEQIYKNSLNTNFKNKK